MQHIAISKSVVNLPGRDQIDSMMVFGKSYPRGVNEIQEAGLTRGAFPE